MQLIDISIEHRVFFGISAMVLLFAGFLVVFVSGQRKKLQYHKNLQALYEEQQKNLTLQNQLLEKRVQERTLELSYQKDELQKSLQGLKSAQLQLIQKEKMASLGELTAGIAHEIQNPLNFVNNFSDLSLELVDDLQRQLETGEKEEAVIVAKDIQQNLQKIYNHGRKADSIVKAMLEHSRVNAGQEQVTDLNSLIDESLKLSYHGFKAKDKNFEAVFNTYFDPAVGKLALIPQDIGRVLINLINNAFYSIHEKKRRKGDEFSPTVSIATRKLQLPESSSRVVIEVKDNGVGVSKKLLDKVYQPFFTTKPTGEGTGLGLSLSYDIIKAHGGEMRIESEEGEFANFIVELPMKEA